MRDETFQCVKMAKSLHKLKLSALDASLEVFSLDPYLDNGKSMVCLCSS